MKVFLSIFATSCMAIGVIVLVFSSTAVGEIMGLLSLVCAFSMFGAVGIMDQQEKQIALQRLSVELQRDTHDKLALLLSKIEPDRVPPRS